MSANTYGRQVVLPLTNKSGGGVVAGDVVVIDTTNNDAFTTTTSASFTGTVGIAQETIASNAIGRVLLSGYAALVNVNASVTRGHYGATFTVAKQATDAGATRSAGCFVQFLTGGTTPDGIVYAVDPAGATGNVATDNIWAASGDIVVGTGVHTAAVLTKGATGTVPTAGASTLAYALPPGHEIDYVERTTDLGLTATTEGTAQTLLTSTSLAYDGTAVVFDFFSCDVRLSSAGGNVIIILTEGASVLGRLATLISPAAASMGQPVRSTYRFTPSAATHQYVVKAYTSSAAGSPQVGGGGGGSGNSLPCFLRVTKV